MLDARIGLVFAAYEVAIAAIPTIAAVPAEEADADALTHSPPFDIGAHRVDSPHSLVARYTRPLNRENAFDGGAVRMTHPARLDAYSDLARRLIGEKPFGQFMPPRLHCLHYTDDRYRLY